MSDGYGDFLHLSSVSLDRAANEAPVLTGLIPAGELPLMIWLAAFLVCLASMFI
jgi:hypothetical protein